MNGLTKSTIMKLTSIHFILIFSVMFSLSIPESIAQQSTLYFDGLDDYVAINNYTNMSPVNAVTMEAWVQGFPSGQKQFIYDRIETNDGYGITVDSSGVVRVTINGGTAVCVSNTTVLDGTWHHVAGTYDAANGMIIVYVDGTPENSTAYSQNITYNPEPRNGIGGPGSSAAGHFNGQIDEVRIWSYARSASQIQNNMCTNISPLNNPDLLAYWKFNEGSGNSLTDVSLYSNDGALTNGPLWVTDSACIPTLVVEIDLNSLVDIFPNPATDHFIVNVIEEHDEQISFKVFDPLGRLLKHLAELKPGSNYISTEFAGEGLVYVAIYDRDQKLIGVKPVMIR
mgnify:CR=1 FL=1